MRTEKISNKEIELWQEEPQQPLSMHPKKFAVWLFIVSIVMIFAALTSAYLVRRAEGNWLEFELPAIFWINSAILLASSISIQWAYFSAKKDNLNSLKAGMVLTVVLAIAFLVGQWYSWVALVDRQVFFVGNPSGSFLYVLTGLHAVHLVTGLVFLVIMLIASFQFKIHAKSMVRMEMCTTYWHFLDILWLYLFVFLLINH
ncbi:cytochrome oxidase subunit III [Rhodocytophaga rosea]|uniref:Cytochrome oxidase subunit III n=1 Tax=Rhodocytophaga rosea TaxID=2704465 RepID=A0A6C0GF39_9BACT|nr:cytochrome c oxidase subunit 3 [Rhodocytophaga rosea]QHT66605.1 cytochrome oxidase subunit III [Rhodocytophaga rosea]